MKPQANPRPPLAGRYRVGTVIGIGGFGTVYDAYDEVTRSRVALKCLREVDPQRLFLFKQEFRLLADCRHPQLVRYYEMFEDRERWYLSMEHIDGVDILSFVRGGSVHQADSTTMTRSAMGAAFDKNGEILSAPRPIARASSSDVLVANDHEIHRLRSVLPQLASGLEHLHANNLVHRDLTPRNIMVDQAGRLIILDFGLALRGTGTSVMRNLRVGTPKYMAPEQVSSEPSTSAADWYAVGSIIYEMLTGIAPFIGSSSQILNAKRTTKPTDPRELHPHLPEDLCQLAMELLAFDPSDRPSDAGDRLRACAVATARTHATQRSATAMPFIGRESQLAQLDKAWRMGIRDNKASVVILRAPSGMGKSALIERFVDKLPAGEQLILRSRCYQHESVPFKALDGLADAIGEFLQDTHDDQLHLLLPEGLAYVTRLFPSLCMVPRIAELVQKTPPSVSLDPHELRRRGFMGLRDLFTRLCEHQRVVVFIDDIQWGDEDSLAALVDIMAPPSAPPVFLVMSGRTEDDGSTMLERVATIFNQVNILPENISLGPLSVKDIEELSSRMGATDGDLRGLVDVVFRDSGGHPLFMRELMMAGMQGPLAGNQPTLRDLLARRLIGLSATARHLIEVAAVAGRPRSLSILHRAIEQGDNLAAAVHQLGADRLVRLRHVQGRDELGVYHDKVAETAIALLSPERLRGHHAAMASALLEIEQPEAEAEALSMHLLASGDQQRGWKYGVIAAERATQSLAFERAAALYRTLLPLMPSDVNRAEFLVQMADVLANAGHGVEAARAYLEAGSDPRFARRQDALQRSAGQFLRSGYMDDGLAVAKQVLQEVGIHWHQRSGSALISLLWRRLWLRLRGIKFTQQDPATIPAADRLKMDALWSLGHGLGGVDTVRGAEFQIKHLLMALKAGDPYRIGRGVAWESILNASEGGPGGRRRAQFYYTAAQTIATSLGNEHAAAWSWAAAGYDHWCKGEWEAAISCNEKAARGYREECHDITWELGSVYAWCSLPVLCYSGRLNELRTMVGHVEREFGQLNDLYTLVTMRTVVTPWLALADGDPVRAEKDSADAVASWSKEHWHLQHLFARMAAARAALYQGQGGKAWEMLNECWPRFTSAMQHLLQNKRMFMTDLRGQAGIMAILNGELPSSELPRVERDVRKLEGEKTPWAEAYAFSLRAGIALINKQPDRAASYYKKAIDAFELRHMPLHVAAARIRLGQLTKDETLIDSGMSALIKLGVKEPARFASAIIAGPAVSDRKIEDHK